MMSGAAFVLHALIAAAPPQIWVEDGELAPLLVRELALELGASRIAATSSAADIRCRLVREASGARLEVDSVVSGPLLRRKIALAEDDRTAAVRVAVLLIARVAVERPARSAKKSADPVVSPLAVIEERVIVEPEAPPADVATVASASAEPAAELEPTPELEPATARESESEPELAEINAIEPAGAPRLEPAPLPLLDTWSYGVTAQGAFATWQKPFTARAGAGFAAWIESGAYGAAIELDALLCCNASGDITVNATELLALAEGRLAILELDPLTFSIALGLGVRSLSAEARSTVFEATGTLQELTLLQGAGRAKAVVELETSDVWSVHFAAGITGFVGSGAIDLPPPFRTGTPPFDAGRVAPWLSAGVSYRIR